jgi:hypothetical protein
MAIKVLKKTQTIEDFNIDLSDYAPCCDAWRDELGGNIILAPNNSGVLPDNIFRRRMILGEVKFRALITPWNYCPFCGQPVGYQLHDGKDITEIEAGMVKKQAEVEAANA